MSINFRFLNRILRSFFLIFIFSLFVCLKIVLAEEGQKSSFQDYNIIILFIDTLRPDHLNCYGYHRKTAPHSDNLAKESVLFENHFTPATYTLPSAMSIFTSLYPPSHGVFYIGKDKLSLKTPLLAEILKDKGYQTNVLVWTKKRRSSGFLCGI